jgi:ferric-dicitrate binding protein FerR (iron transport regulator)
MAKHFLLIEELIIKYARRKRLSRYEQRVLRQWQEKSDYHRVLPELFRDHEWLRHNLQRMDEVPADRMWEFVRDRIAASLSEEPVLSNRSRRMLLQWAGGVAVLIALVGFGYFYLPKPTVQDQHPTTTYTNVQSGPFTVHLPDSSTVTLGYGSKLSLGFSGKARDLTVTGQAFFEIAKHPNWPLKVHTKKATVEVLGTSFIIKGYEDEPGTTITLKDGAIRVGDGQDTVRLRPDEQVVVTDGMPMRLKTVEASESLAWAEKDPLFHFVDDDLQTVVRELARFYKLKVTYVDHVDVTGDLFTGDLRQRDSLDYNLLQINRVVRGNARLVRSDQSLIICPGLVSR